MAEFNTLLVEALAGTEIHMDQLLSAQSRKDKALCIHYRTQTGTVSTGPLCRVEVLTRLYPPWSTISYGGCQNLRQDCAETLGKYEALYECMASRDGESMFSRAPVDEDRQYVLLGLSSGDFHPDLDLSPDSVQLLGWGPSPEVWASGYHPGVDQIQLDPGQAYESVYPGVDIDGPKKICGVHRAHLYRV